MLSASFWDTNEDQEESHLHTYLLIGTVGVVGTCLCAFITAQQICAQVGSMADATITNVGNVADTTITTALTNVEATLNNSAGHVIQLSSLSCLVWYFFSCLINLSLRFFF